MSVALHSISLCTGLAGLELGVSLALRHAFSPILYVERELTVASLLAEEIEAGRLPPAGIWSDIKTLCDAGPRRYVRAALGGRRLALLTGGYPCQPFSTAGKRRGVDDPRHLWPWIDKAIGQYRPAICFFENVAAHLDLGFGAVRRNLEDRSYRVQAGIFAACETGAPHLRKRLFILAVDESEISRWRRECVSAGRRREGNGAGHAPGAGAKGGTLELAECHRRTGERPAVGRSGEADGASQVGDVHDAECRSGQTGHESAGRKARPIAAGRCDGAGMGVLEHSGRIGGATGRDAGDVAGSAGGTETDAQKRERLRDSAGDGRAVVEHAASARLGRRKDAGTDRSHASADQRGRDESERTDTDLGHAECNGLRVRRGTDAEIIDSGLPLFPPARNNTDGWRDVLARFPDYRPALTSADAQSALRRLADGASSRLDSGVSPRSRIRAVGNSVVPQCAAVAFLGLWAGVIAESITG